MAELAVTRTISASIDRSPPDVYAFIVDPRNLPQWVPSFAAAVRPDGDRWMVEMPDGGSATVAFVPENVYLVADHDVVIGDATVVNPLRVIANHGGSEVLFTLVQGEEQDNAAFDELAGLVQRDLLLLKALLEA